MAYFSLLRQGLQSALELKAIHSLAFGSGVLASQVGTVTQQAGSAQRFIHSVSTLVSRSSAKAEGISLGLCSIITGLQLSGRGLLC